MIELYNNWYILVTPAFCARKEMDILDKKKVRKGFTLVELIVVLVILAILAALLIPALTGYIDKARKSQVIAETRMITQAVQAEMSELYALSFLQKPIPALPHLKVEILCLNMSRKSPGLKIGTMK